MFFLSSSIVNVNAAPSLMRTHSSMRSLLMRNTYNLTGSAPKSARRTKCPLWTLGSLSQPQLQYQESALVRSLNYLCKIRATSRTGKRPLHASLIKHFRAIWGEQKKSSGGRRQQRRLPSRGQLKCGQVAAAGVLARPHRPAVDSSSYGHVDKRYF